MNDETLVSGVEFASKDKKSLIKGIIWEPSQGVAPRGIVQIVHGMVEHVARYDRFARYLAKQGYAVCGEDHAGHGRSVASSEDLGHLPLNGKEILIADVHELRVLMQRRYDSSIPYFMFGHSMGSFIVRAYVARHGNNLAGAILCGTGQQPILLSRGGNVLARTLATFKGDRYRSELMHKRGVGAYSSQIKNARTSVDWISSDPKVVDDYLVDELCGAMFSVGGYATLTDLTSEIASRACVARIPQYLPVLLVAGELDPVGNLGEGVKTVADQLSNGGVKEVEVRLYPSMRHEILNEPGHIEVYEDIIQWIEERL